MDLNQEFQQFVGTIIKDPYRVTHDIDSEADKISSLAQKFSLHVPAFRNLYQYVTGTFYAAAPSTAACATVFNSHQRREEEGSAKSAVPLRC